MPLSKSLGSPPFHGASLPGFPALLCASLLALALSVTGASTGTPPSSDAASALPWVPTPGKYLLAICLYGRLTNQIFCMRAYLQLAQALNRTLLVPSWGVALNWEKTAVAYSFRWDTPVDWERMGRCLEPQHGPHAVLTVDKYLTLHKTNTVNVTFYQGLVKGRNWAYPPGLASQEFSRLNGKSLTLPPRSSVPEGPILRVLNDQATKASLAEVIRVGASVQDDVITFGEMFGFQTVTNPSKIRVSSHECSNLWRPHIAVIEFVDGVAEHVLGGDYAALHLRRGDFYKYRSLTGEIRGARLVAERGFPPILDAATKCREKMEALNITRLFVASNARKLELNLFSTIVREPKGLFKVKTVITLSNLLEQMEWLKEQPWAKRALSLEKDKGTNGLVLSLIDKFLCVRSRLFWPSSGSTFSMEVGSVLRRDEKMPS